jgi:S1-C subfamily serine protease
MIKIVVTNTRRIAWGAALFATIVLAGETAFAQPAEDLFATASTSAENSVKLVAVVLALPAGTPWLSVRMGQGFCIYPPDVTSASGEREKQDVTAYAPSFKSELERAGYKVVTPGEENLFDPQASSADYQAAAVISDVRVDACVSRGGLFAAKGSVRGDSSMKIDWQIYSPIKKQIVARVSTSGAGKLENSIQGGYQRLLMEAFSSNVRDLAQNASFREALNAPKALTNGFVMPGQQSKIPLAGSLKAGPRRIDDAAGSVVMLMTGSGTGSGVLVSEDGYILTNAHVVGDEKTIRVRWPDRIETIAQVIRSAKDRDVAIIKTNPRDRIPLAIKRGPLTPGQRVYAIGTPLDKAFQGTVSSGIVSANRLINGLRYIQSDTTVSHGSSGGALLDETGSVIGLTDLGVPNDGPAGLNLFIPIGDAMDFLSLEQR